MFDYEAISVKCRAMAANILTEEDLTALFETGSLEGFYNGLCASGKYIGTLPDKEVTVNREYLENLADYNFISAYRKLYLFAGGQMRELIRTAVEIRYIGILFKLLRIVDEGGDISLRYSVIPGWYGQNSTLNWPAIVSADTPEKLLENFKSYPEYCEIIRRYIKEDGKLKNTGMMEIETVNLYYKRMLNLSGLMSGEHAERFENLLFAEINGINEKRSRRLSGFDTDGGVRYLIPVPKEKSEIRTGVYKAAEKEIRNNPGPAVVYAMFKLKERENKRVIKTVECLRYSLTREEFERFVFED